MEKAASRAEAIFKAHGVRLTIGGEPTFVPIDPDGAEWTYAAVGPTKLGYAQKVAENLKAEMPGSATFFCPGKSYPGEVNPRWVLRILANRDGTPLLQLPKLGATIKEGGVRLLAEGIRKGLGLPAHWLRFADPRDPRAEILAMLIDYDDGGWHSAPWSLSKDLRVLVEAEGPSGLRLPLNRLPPSIPRRALCIEKKGEAVGLFVPPLLQKPFLELLAAVEGAASQTGIASLAFEGYTPVD
jgi:uncharacterized protein (DUF2126 family)